MSTVSRFSYLSAAIISLLFAATTASIGQVNDNLVNAVSIPSTLPFADTLSNAGASTEPGELFAPPECAPVDQGNSIWWSFSPSFTGEYLIETEGSSFDTILKLYTGSGHPLTLVDCNDDVGGGQNWSSIVTELTVGATYLIGVTAFSVGDGSVVLGLKIPQDGLEDAVFPLDIAFSDTASNVGTGVEADELLSDCVTPSNDGKNSVWWSFTPTFSDTLIADTDSTSFDTVIDVFTGSAHPLVRVGCNDDFISVGGPSSVKFPVVSGVTYHFRVIGFFGADGDVVFHLTHQGDLSREAIPIAGLPFADTTSNVGMRVEPGETPASCVFSDGLKSVWWRWTAPAAIDVTVDTDNSGFDTNPTFNTVLSLRNDISLTEIACDDDDGNPVRRSKLHFTATQGQSYLFRVTGVASDTGTVILNVRESVTFTGKVLLEGAYAGTGAMGVSVGFENSIPVGQPYADASYNASFLDYDGVEAVQPFGVPANAVDWIVASLRTGTAAATEVPGSEQALLLFEDGSIVGADGATVRLFAAPGLYNLVLRHRNHLGVMSKMPVDFTSGSGSWDFTTADKAFTAGGPPMKDLEDGFFAMFATDASLDGQTTASDFNLWLTDTKAAATGYLQSDFNLDAQVTASDFNLWLTNTKAAASSKVP